ncbi:MAG: transketolase [Verrucomicrobia bacterium]|nr:transketolase [Verrucomicrobiota bacterium]
MRLPCYAAPFALQVGGAAAYTAPSVPSAGRTAPPQRRSEAVHHIGFAKESLDHDDIDQLQAAWQRCARRIILSTMLAGSGHPGGSLSTLHMLLTVYATGRFNPKDPYEADRDRVFISHGHTSPGTYSVLCEAGFFGEEEMLLGFRRAGSIFAGHVENTVPGVEWTSGNLGQGLSAGCGSALAAKLHGKDFKVIVAMGDGEQQKGQISEARRFAMKYGLGNLIALVDWNKLQIGGDIRKIMPQNIVEEWQASGWNIIELDDGHNWDQIYTALRAAYTGAGLIDADKPTVILANTVMGKGVSFMQNDAEFHGKAPSVEQARKALAEIGLDADCDALIAKRKALTNPPEQHRIPAQPINVDTGTPRTYDLATKTDNRSGYGNALQDLGQLNNLVEGRTRVVAMTCDLEGSVKMGGFHKTCPGYFVEGGIQEHNSATLAGRLSIEGCQVFFSSFGVFGVSETYNQERLNDINQTNLKLVCTHIGLDVGEDGPTHQSIDYIGLLACCYGFRVFIPADPNQTDRVIRHAASTWGNCFVGMGRSKMSMLATADGASPLFGGDYTFVEGKADLVRDGDDAAIIAIGPMLHEAVKAHDALTAKGLNVRVVNMCSVVPIDRAAIVAAAKTGVVVTAEDHNVNTGLGTLVGNVIAEEGVACRFRKCGVPRYGASGAPAELFKAYGLDAAALAAAVEKLTE